MSDEHPLTKREQAVLDGVRDGLSPHVIAYRLFANVVQVQAIINRLRREGVLPPEEES